MLTNWLNTNAPGYETLSEEERDAIIHFSLLWSLFEGQVLDTSGSAKLIQEKVNLWHKAGLLGIDDFEAFKHYFVHRYIENGELNNKFQNLQLKRNDKPDLVQAVLKGDDNNINNVVTTLLIIVLRYRNNFFHGLKWAYEFHDQLDNFKKANNLLMKVIEINKVYD